MATQKQKALAKHFSAGGVVYRKQDKTTEWLLIQPAGTQRWQLPKGTIDEGEKSVETAVREVEEETGIKAEIIEKIETLKYFFIQDEQRIFKSVVFYLMEVCGGEARVDERWAHEIQDVQWFETAEAIEKLSFKNEKKILEGANELLQNRLI